MVLFNVFAFQECGGRLLLKEQLVIHLQHPCLEPWDVNLRLTATKGVDVVFLYDGSMSNGIAVSE